MAGSSGSLITPSDANQSRFNVGIRSLEAGVSMDVTVYDMAGTKLRTRVVSYPPNYFVQVPFADLTGAPAGTNQAVVFSVRSGSAIVYGSAADNSGRGMTIQIATPAANE